MAKGVKERHEDDAQRRRQHWHPETDHLTAGDAFELERLTPGHYLLTRQPPPGSRFTAATAEDGLPVIRTENGTITSRMVKDVESQTP